jgi:fatty-acyl-CoA synthase
VFLRVVEALALTATFKLQKRHFSDVGYDPGATADALYVNDRHSGAFARLDAALHQRIQAGEVRL